MKSSSSMGRDSFEKAFQERFEGAEIQPSEGLWAGIEAAIANDEVAKYRRGMAHYRWIAAAGILLVAGVFGYLGYNSWSGSSGADITGVEQPVPDNQPDINNVPGINAESQQSVADNKESLPADSNLVRTNKVDETGQTESISAPSKPNESLPGKPSLTSATPAPGQQTGQATTNPLQETVLTLSSENKTDAARLPGYTELATVDPARNVVESDLLVSELPESISGVIVYPTTKQSGNTVFWAGLNMAPGYFDPNYSQQSIQAASPNYLGNSGSPAAQEDHQSGLSMAFGVEMGMQLSNRWQLSSGIQYLNNNVQSSTNLVLDNRTPVFSSTERALNLSDATNANVSYEPTELDNTFQFISIPVQAGYLLLDSKVKLQVNAGIASDVFLKNRITAVNRSLESVTINPGSDAPFRSVYFNGLFGAQASYEFLPRYLITLEPRYKLALNEFTRSNLNYSSMPSSFGVGVGVKYLFK